MLHSLKQFDRLLFILALACLCMGCTVVPVQADTSQELLLIQGESLGQTFVAEFDGLEAIQLFFYPVDVGEGSLVLHLRSEPQSSDDLATARLPLAGITGPGYYTFQFAPQSRSARQYYYALVEVEGGGQVTAGTGSGGSYQQGAAYRNQIPLNQQLGFSLGYQPIYQSLGLAREVAWGNGLLLVGAFLFLLPGWGLLAWALPGWKWLPWPARLGLAGGVSLAGYAVLLLAGDLVHLRLGGWLAWLPAAGGAGLWVSSRLRPVPESHAEEEPIPADRGADLVFALVLALVIFSRLASVRMLEAPMWGDSLQHTMVVQLMLEHGGLFDSWAPYAEATTFTYHFGFHAAAAAFAWLTHLPADRAVLWTGQLLNILAVVSLYPLALRLSRNRWAGTVAVLVGGLLANMPMFYTNWGRYPQLAGQVILPVLITLAWAYLEGELANRAVVAVWIALAGLAMTHYRILVLAGLFFFTWLVLRGIALGLPALRRFFVLAAGGGVLFLPWFLHVFEGTIMTILSAQLSSTQSLPGNVSNNIGNLSYYFPAWLWLLALAAFLGGHGLFRFKERWIWTVWLALVLLAANPERLGLPGSGVVNNFTVFIAAYIPASLWIGAGAGSILSKTPNRWRLFCAGILMVLAVWGASDRLEDVQPDRHALLTRPDWRAAAWINNNLPADAVFMINSFPAFGMSQAGSDGGWWLSFTAHRRVNIPPMSNGFEEGLGPGKWESINILPETIRASGISSPQARELFTEQGITHIYAGQLQGASNSPFTLVDIDALLNSALFRMVYHQDRVWVFEVVQ